MSDTIVRCGDYQLVDQARARSLALLRRYMSVHKEECDTAYKAKPAA